MINLLHISDLHFTSSTEVHIKRVLNALTTASSKQINHIIISGDLANKGIATDYEIAGKILIEFAQSINCTTRDITIAPGNHDVNRAIIDEFLEDGYRARLKTAKDAAALWHDQKKRAQALTRQSEFHKFASTIGCHDESHILSCEDFELGIAPMNSAWRSSDDSDKGRLFLSTTQLLEARDKIKDCDVRIATFHHPISWLHDDEQDDILGNLSAYFHLVCTGHRHSVDSAHRTAPRESAMFLAAKAIWDPIRPLGANLVEISVANSQVQLTVKHLSYISKHNRFAPDTEVSDDGLHAVSIALSATSADHERALLRKISRADSDELRRSVEILAPSLATHLERVPLTPTLTVSDDPNEAVELTELFDGNQPTVIFGPRLSGKTFALRALLKRAWELGRAAVLFSARHMTNPRDLAGTLAKGISISRSEAQKVLATHPILLIDDLDLSNPDHTTFLKTAKDYQVVCVAQKSRWDHLAAASRDIEQTLSYRRLDLQPVPLKQISALGKQLEAMLAIPENVRYMRKLISESFDTSLPRQPWIVLVFFELLAGSQISAGLTLSQLLLRYTSHRLGAEAAHVQSTIDVASRALGWLADKMMQLEATDLSEKEATNSIALGLRAADLALDEAVILMQLSKSGLLATSSDVVSFSFPVFQEFFYATYLSTLPRIDDLDINSNNLPRLGGALSLLAGLRDSKAIASQVFAITKALRPTVPLIIEANLLAELRIFGPRSVLDRIDNHPLRLDDIDEETSSVADRRIERHKKRLTTNVRGDVDRFFSCYGHSLTLLRHAAFLSRDDKDRYVTLSIDNTIALIHILLENREAVAELIRVLVARKNLEIDDKTAAYALITMLIIFIGTAFLSNWGAGEHLERAIHRVCEDIKEHPSRRVVAIAWYMYIGGQDVNSLVARFVDSRPEIPYLMILEAWLTIEYSQQVAYTGKKPQKLRDALHEVARALALAYGGSSRVASAVAAETVAKTEQNARSRGAK